MFANTSSGFDSTRRPLGYDREIVYEELPNSEIGGIDRVIYRYERTRSGGRFVLIARLPRLAAIELWPHAITVAELFS